MPRQGFIGRVVVGLQSSDMDGDALWRHIEKIGFCRQVGRHQYKTEPGAMVSSLVEFNYTSQGDYGISGFKHIELLFG
jgi:hypothetical protein